MANPLNRLLLRYMELAEDSADRLYKARDEVRARNYRPRLLISDYLQLWLNAVDAWYAPYETGTNVVKLTAKGGADDAVGALVGVADPGGAIQSTTLTGVFTGSTITTGVTPTWTAANGGILEVSITGISGASQDLYVGAVELTATNVSVAKIELVVIP